MKYFYTMCIFRIKKMNICMYKLQKPVIMLRFCKGATFAGPTATS